MVRLRDIPRTAAFAWSPGAGKPFIVTGTRAGAVDADFSDETKLELWDLKLDSQDQGLELQPIASITTDSRLYDIAWGQPDEDHPRGIIAGALENGALDLWDAEKLASGASDALIARTTKHSGAIKSLQFNPIKPQILATAGAKGELFIWDVNDPSNPFRLGTAAARSDDLECVAWNRKVPNILATGGSGGFVTVWDLKTKKASLTLNNSRKAVSSIAWDPQNSTKLLTATPDDNTPFILIWNLRNSNAPERTLQGHEQGVLSLSWCQQDSDLLISSGKDNRTLLWNPQTGEQYGEFPEVTNWTFSTRFNPHNPNLSATASFDGKITIQTLQNTNPSTAQTAVQNNLDGEDFFTKAQTQPQGASFTLTKAPAWFERPVGASFGFGGKIVIIRQDQSAHGQKRSSKVQISHFSVDSDIGTATEQFENSLRTGGLKSICEERVEHAKTDEEKADWQVMATLIAENPRQQVVEYLGLAQEPEDQQSGDMDAATTEETEAAPAENKKASPSGHKKRLSTFFADGGDGEDFLADLAAAKGAKTDNPFHLLNEGNTSLEDAITRALTLGNFSKAVDICLKEDRIADAFIIANCGGKELVDKVQAAYLSSKKGSPSYLRLLSSVIAENLWDVVYNAGLADWKETMATLCTFAKPTEFPDLCEALGDRILETGSRKDASFCYLVGSKLEKVVSIWVNDLEESEQAGLREATEGSTFSIHAKSLQLFIEKVTVFRMVTKFQDNETSQTSDWKLASLYDKYTEYADIVASHGQLAVAQKYLDLLPSTYPAAEVARNRVKLASQKGAAPTGGRQPATAARTTSRAQPSIGYQPPQGNPGLDQANPYGAPVHPPAPNPYAPTQPTPYAPAGTPYGQPTQGYSPSGYAPPQPTGYTPPANYGQPGAPFGAPPRNATPSTLPPPPKVKKEAGQWNDVPIVSKAPVRKSTPSMAPITSPFGAQPGAPMPPPGPPTGPFGGQRSVATPPPPPPKGSAPPRVTSPLAGLPQGSQLPLRPPSTAANTYAPPPPPQGVTPGPPAHAMPLRTASPYNNPPGVAPPSNRYAPSPAAQQQFSQPPQQYSVAPPPSGAGRPPPPNPYAPAPQQQGAPSPYAPSPYAAGSAQPGPPPTGPPPMGRPPTGPPPWGQAGPPPGNAAATPPPPKAVAPPPRARHPAGDRSHIPANAQRMVEILSRDVQRVSSKAPEVFQTQVKDTVKRLNLLFDHLNNEELVKPDTVGQLTQLAEALEAKQYDIAHGIQVDIHREKPEECGNWMVGVKRLISMSKATP